MLHHYYGWIPTLVGEDTFDLLYNEFSSAAEKLPNEIADKVKLFVKNELKWDVDRSKILVISRSLYDLEKSNNLIFLKFRDWKIEEIAIVKGDLKKIDDKSKDDKSEIINEHKKIAKAKIDFCGKGLIKIDLEVYREKYDERNVARQVFRIVRDVYHVHTHHKYQDVLLEPVDANNIDDAKDKLLKQYLKKIVDYHKEIKKRVDSGFWHYFSVFKYKDAENTILQAIGEILYGESFSEMFNPDYISRFKRARVSIEALHNRIKSKHYLIPIILAIPSVFLLTFKYSFSPFISPPSADFFYLLFLVVSIYLLTATLFSIFVLSLVSYVFKFGIVSIIKDEWNNIKKIWKSKRYETGIFSV